jgi:hypothetical protein
VALSPSRGSSRGGGYDSSIGSPLGGEGELWQRSSAPKSRSIEERKDAEGWGFDDLLLSGSCFLTLALRIG